MFAHEGRHFLTEKQADLQGAGLPCAPAVVTPTRSAVA